MLRKTALLALPLTAALIGGGAFLFSSTAPNGKATPPATVPPAIPVIAGTVQSGDVPIYLRGIGTVQAYNTDVIRAQIQGQITQIAFKEGQSVRAGDLLAQIDPRPFQAQLDQAIANRDRDRALLANAQANLQRDSALLTHGYATPQAVDLDKANAGQYGASVKADEAAIEYAQTQLDFTRITSPVGGVTGIRLIDIGNIVHPTDANGLVVVTQLQPISVIFTLPETDLPQIQQQMAKGNLTVLAYSQDDKNQLDQGILEVLDNQILQTSGAVRLNVDGAAADVLAAINAAVDDDLFAGRQPGIDDGLLVAHLPDGDRPAFDRSVGLDGIDIGALRPLLHGRRGDPARRLVQR